MRGRIRAPRFLTSFVIPAGVALLMVLGGTMGWLQQLENVTVDWRFRARARTDRPADPRLVVVGIGEYSLKRVGRWEEWTRKVHAHFLERLLLRPPTVVAYDFLFTERSRDPEGDEAFAYQLENFPGAVTGAVADDTRMQAPPHAGDHIGKTRPLAKVRGDRSALIRAPAGPVPVERIAQASWTGFVNSPPSGVDGVRRKIPLVVEFGGEVYPSFVLQILMQLDEVRPEEVEVVLGEEIVLGIGRESSRRIPIDRAGFMGLNYRGRRAFEPVDYIGVVEWLNHYEQTGEWPEDRPALENQVVLIGQMAEGLSDFGPTPLAPREPLVLTQAVALNNILQSDYLRQAPLWLVLLGWIPVWGLHFLLRQSSVTWSIALPLGIVVAYLSASFVVFQTHSLLLPVAVPVGGFLVIHAGAVADRLVAEMRAKSRIKNLFGAFAPPQIVEAIIASGEDPKLGGEEVEITAFFSDIRGFSTFSEQLAPEPLVALMNEYLSSMTDELLGCGGSLDKYIGDAIVGMFGAPLPMADHAYRACAATIEMQRRQLELCEKWRRDGRWPEIVLRMRTRIGLNSGPAVVGHMGSPRRLHYGMMGDTVNLAARCESGAKSYGVFTMITGETRDKARAAQDNVAFRYLDKIVVKGRSQPAEVYEVLGFEDGISAETRDCLEIYARGMRLYLDRRWDQAKAEFTRSAELERHRPETDPDIETNPSLVMIGRCLAMKADPPGDDWDGRYVMKSK